MHVHTHTKSSVGVRVLEWWLVCMHTSEVRLPLCYNIWLYGLKKRKGGGGGGAAGRDLKIKSINLASVASSSPVESGNEIGCGGEKVMNREKAHTKKWEIRGKEIWALRTGEAELVIEEIAYPPRVCVCVLQGSRSYAAETLILLCFWLLTVWRCNYAGRAVRKTLREGKRHSRGRSIEANTMSHIYSHFTPGTSGWKY